MGYFLTITDEMIKWGLNGSELLVFALINGYSQRGLGCYYGSLENTAEMCGLSRATALRTLQSLTEKGFLLKGKSVINGDARTTYTAVRVSKCNSEEYQNDTASGIKMIPNNKDININNTLSYKGGGHFRKPSLDEVKSYCRERGNSVNAERFFDFYESNGWMVGKNRMKDWKAAVRTWEGRPDIAPKASSQPQHKESVLEHNIKVYDQLFGTHEHERIYGKKKEDYDEQ